MSYDYRYQSSTNRRGGRAGRPLYAPPPPSRGSSSHHSLLGYWVPVIVTGTIAIGGLAAWIWSERHEHDEDDYRPDQKPPRPPTGAGAPYPPQGSQSYSGPPGQPGGPGQGPPPNWQGPPPSQATGPQNGPPPAPPVGGEAASYYNASSTEQRSQMRDVNSAQQEQAQDDSSWYGRVSGMMKRTPSPQQLFDSAGKQVSAGVVAAGAALGSIMEDSDEHYDDAGQRRREGRSGEKRVERRTREERDGFSDHERWSEEADERRRGAGGAVEAESERRAEAARRDEKGKGKAGRAVAVIVSAATNSELDHDDDDAGYRTEHASILSHLPGLETSNLFVLIYSPGLKSLPPIDYKPNLGPETTPATTPGSELQSISPRVMAQDSSSPGRQFDALYQQALSLVSSPTQILPFTTPDGYVHILRHLAPQLVYISDTLSGDDGEFISQLKGWVGHTILVAGDEGHGGLADTETEDEGTTGNEKRRWYDHSSLVGLGKEVEVVDAVRVGEDWSRRVGGRE